MSAEPIDVRVAGPGDENAVWPLARALATSGRPERDAFADAYRRILQDSDAAILVAVTPPGEVVGYAHVLVHSAFHANGAIAWVEELMVAAGHRRGGCGRALMRASERWAVAEHRVAYLALATRRAAPFYRALGYEESAVYFKRPLR